MNAPITIDLVAPSTGHFIALGPMPKTCPDVLMSTNGIRAYRVEDLGDHNSIFALESFGHLIPASGRVTLVPLADGQPVIDYSAHPAVLDDLGQILGELEIGGFTGKPNIVHENADQQSRIMQRFRVDWDCTDYWVRVWVHIFARSPAVQCSGLVIRKDRALATAVPFKMQFGEECELAPSSRWLGLHTAGDQIHGAVTLERGGVMPFRFALLCRSVKDDDLTHEAIEAARGGQRWFIPTGWEGQWLGADPVFGTAFGIRAAERALDGLDNLLGDAEPYDSRPYASAPNANQGGAQNSLGVSWWAPAFVPQRLRPQEVHLWCAQDYAFRPVHLLTPGTPEPIALGLLPPGPTDTVDRQVYGTSSLGDMILPRHATKGQIRVDLGAGRSDVRGAHDEQHMADGPLLAAYAMTGDPALRWLIRSHQVLDLAQKRPRAGWSNASRGDGRTIVAMLEAASLIGNRDAVEDHCRLRMANVIKNAPGKALAETVEVRPGRVQNDPRLSCQHPALVPYEEAVLAWAAWLLDDYATAASFGMAVATSLWHDGTQWTAPYAITWQSDGSALPITDRAPTSPYVHPGDWLEWSGCGLRALLLAIEKMAEVPESWAPHIANARAAVEQIEASAPRTLDRAHISGWRTAVPAAPVEGAR